MKNHFVSAVALAAFVVVAHAPAVLSAEKAPAAKPAVKNGLTQDLTKVSHDGYGALRAIHGARIAMFNGETKVASEMLDRAQKDLDAATKDAQAFAVDMKAADRDKKADSKSTSDKTDLIPIDGNIAIADTFVTTPEKKAHIEKANEHLKSGRSKEAIEELQLGEVDIIYTCVLLPLESTKKRVADAEAFVKDHKYYEANLALKAAEDGIIVDSVDLLGNPVPASNASAATSVKK